MTNGILLNGSADIDFMIHGVFPYQFFGQTGYSDRNSGSRPRMSAYSW
mgnify:CR=1 FL=1